MWEIPTGVYCVISSRFPSGHGWGSRDLPSYVCHFTSSSANCTCYLLRMTVICMFCFLLLALCSQLVFSQSATISQSSPSSTPTPSSLLSCRMNLTAAFLLKRALKQQREAVANPEGVTGKTASTGTRGSAVSHSGKLMYS